jgi:hypothetical protein
MSKVRINIDNWETEITQKYDIEETPWEVLELLEKTFNWEFSIDTLQKIIENDYTAINLFWKKQFYKKSEYLEKETERLENEFNEKHKENEKITAYKYWIIFYFFIIFFSFLLAYLYDVL